MKEQIDPVIEAMIGDLVAKAPNEEGMKFLANDLRRAARAAAKKNEVMMGDAFQSSFGNSMVLREEKGIDVRDGLRAIHNKIRALIK